MQAARHWIQQNLGMFRWRNKARSKHSVGLRVTGVPSFLRQLEEGGINAAVLRWFEEVPVSIGDERVGNRDVDLLIDGSRVEDAVRIAVNQPGRVKCDLYSNSGVRGTTYRGLPYYPPALAEQILADRVRHPRGFLVPSPKMHLLSLAYHLCYHKGLEAGIDSGCLLAVERTPRRDYAKKFAELAAAAGATVAAPITLLGLHQYLRQHGWDIPLDLLPRWPKQTAWHSWLHEYETQALKAWSQKLPHLLAFFIRDDVVERGLTDAACDMLTERFTLLAVHELDGDAVERVTRRVRGGNWLEHNRATLVPPKLLAVCYDRHPAPVPATCVVGKRQKQARSAYPFVDNGNVFFKHEIRDRLNAMISGAPKIHGIHGADNALEAQYMLRTVFGPATDQTNELFLNHISGGVRAGGARAA